ncbi:DsbA family protein [Amycolatopsis sp. NPDC051102]|uniref:DsbA family protein n=1 Tax=Amycolatopsis sp. NPDC051102 TaxID=3155163 RepID=UPI00343B20E8
MLPSHRRIRALLGTGETLVDLAAPADPGRDHIRGPENAPVTHAGELGLDVDRFREDLRRHTGAGQVAEDVESADLSGVSGTPTFFVNGRRHYGAYDIATLSAAVDTAHKRAVSAAASPPDGTRRSE